MKLEKVRGGLSRAKSTGQKEIECIQGAKAYGYWIRRSKLPDFPAEQCGLEH